MFNIKSNEIKIRIKEHKGEILDIIKLPSNRICASSRGPTIHFIRIFEFFNNNTEFKQIHERDFNASKIIFLQVEKKEKILFYDSEKRASELLHPGYIE